MKEKLTGEGGEAAQSDGLEGGDEVYAVVVAKARFWRLLKARQRRALLDQGAWHRRSNREEGRLFFPGE